MAKPFLFDLDPISRFAVQEVGIRRPKVCPAFLLLLSYSPTVQEIAYFSYDNKHEFHLDDSSLRYYYPPALPADLNQGFDDFQQLDDTNDDHLDPLLATIVAFEQKTGAKVDTDIITWRGMMTKVRGACSGLVRGLCEE